MQAVSAQFNALAAGQVRPLAYRVMMSFDREFDDNVDFFTIGVSAIGGTDFIKGEPDVVLEWDKYQYTDLSHKVISIEWQHEAQPYGSFIQGMADVVFDNHDDYFSADDFALPQRPIRLYAGFGTELIQVFIGLTDKMPVIDEVAKTASFHCIDFMEQIMRRTVDRVTLLQDVLTDDALSLLFTEVGLTSSQFQLDTGLNLIRFAYVDRDEKLETVAHQLVQADLGRLFMDENGLIRFRNRQNFDYTPVYSFDRSNVINQETPREDFIINKVVIKNDVRAVQGLQNVGTIIQPELIKAGETKDVWINFDDPVTSVVQPVPFVGSTTSYYITNTAEDGSGTSHDSDLTINSATLFTTAYLLEIENTSSQDLYITNLIVAGTPATVVDNISVDEQDATSIANFDIKEVRIEDNRFIQSADNALSKALILLDDFSDYGAVMRLDVKGNMALQVDDTVNVSVRSQTYIVQAGDTFASIASAYGLTEAELEDLNPNVDPDTIEKGDLLATGVRDEDVIILSTTNILSGGSYRQRLMCLAKEFRTYFTIGVSAISGPDALAP